MITVLLGVLLALIVVLSWMFLLGFSVLLEIPIYMAIGLGYLYEWAKDSINDVLRQWRNRRPTVRRLVT